MAELRTHSTGFNTEVHIEAPAIPTTDLSEASFQNPSSLKPRNPNMDEHRRYYSRSPTHFHAEPSTILLNYMTRILEVCGDLGSQINAHARIEAHPLGPQNCVL